MSLQWRRVVDVVVGVNGSGFKVSDSIAQPGPRVQFEVTKTLRSSLNTAKIRIFNLGPDNRGQIKGELDDVILNAGYEGQSLLIFRGQIRNVGTPSDGNDDITEIDAADGDRDARKSIVNVTLAAGTTNEQLIDQVVGSFEKTAKGQIVIHDKKRLRGRVISGRATAVLDMIATDSDAHWSFQDGRLDIVAADSTLPTEAIVIRSDTGMLEAPEVDDKGVKVRCLLNPRIRVNGKIQLDNHDVKLKVAKERERQPGAKKPTKAPKAKNLARLDPDGVYKVYKVIHKGDNRGNDWVSEVYAEALQKTIPAGRVAA
jgi:hypothetical protein